jgi:hypothetical protein
LQIDADIEPLIGRRIGIQKQEHAARRGEEFEILEDPFAPRIGIPAVYAEGGIKAGAVALFAGQLRIRK